MCRAAPGRTFWIVLGALGLLTAMLTGRMLYGARSQLKQARAARSAGQRDLQVVHLRRAMAYYVPGNPWVDQATRQLASLAREAEKAGQPDAALRIWRALRSAILGLRGPGQPFADRLPTINQRILQLARQQVRVAARLTTPAGTNALRDRLANPEEPRPGWTALALLGFVLWVGGSLALIFSGCTSQTRIVPRRFWILLGLVAFSLALFWSGLARASVEPTPSWSPPQRRVTNAPQLGMLSLP